MINILIHIYIYLKISINCYLWYMCFEENSFPTIDFYYNTITPFPFYIYNSLSSGVFQWHRRKFPKLWCSNMLTIQLENFIFQLLEYGISKPSSRPQNTKWSGDKEILIPYWQNERSLIRLYVAKEDNISPSFVMRACNPSGGIKVMGHWPSLAGRILWGSCTDLPIPSKEMD